MRRIKAFVEEFPFLKRILRPIYLLYKKVFKGQVYIEEPVKSIASSKPVIFFDITSFSVCGKKTGIQRVVGKFLEYLEEIIADKYDLVYISGLDGYHVIKKEDYSPVPNLSISPKQGDIYLSIDHNPVQPYEYWGSLKEWQSNGCKLIACVYDLVYELYPEFIESNNAVYLLDRWLRHATSNFDGLIAISKTVENELKVWMAENEIYNPKLKVDYFHLGGDFENKKEDNDSTEALFSKLSNSNIQLFLSVATVEPRKGYMELVDAFESALEQNAEVMLVIVGRLGWKCDDIASRILNSKYYNDGIFWLSDCSDELLKAIYGLSDCYISGSYYEGFGLGIIEASSKGLPVLLRDIPINREVSENKGLYYKSTEDLIRVLIDVSSNKELLIQERINSLCWKESVEMAWVAIQKMV